MKTVLPYSIMDAHNNFNMATDRLLRPIPRPTSAILGAVCQKRLGVRSIDLQAVNCDSRRPAGLDGGRISAGINYNDSSDYTPGETELRRVPVVAQAAP
jgi:hypothetical protein